MTLTGGRGSGWALPGGCGSTLFALLGLLRGDTCLHSWYGPFRGFAGLASEIPVFVCDIGS